MKYKYKKTFQIGVLFCTGVFSLFSFSVAFAACSSKIQTACVNDAACEWDGGYCRIRTEAQCAALATVHWENGVCVEGLDPDINTAAGAYDQFATNDPGNCAQYAIPDKCPKSYCQWNSRNQCVEANVDVCDTQTTPTACEALNQCKWKDKCVSRAFGMGEGADEREADCNRKAESDCAISEMCTWAKAVEKDGKIVSPALCHAKSSFWGIGSGKNKEARRLCDEAVSMLQTPNLTAGDQEMYEDQQNTYCSESSYVEEYQGPIFGGPGLKAGAQMSGGYLDASISKERSLPKLAAAWTRFLLQLAAVLAVIAFITAGIFYVTDFGDGSRIESAKKIIIWTVVGILLILGSYAIVNTLMKARFGDTDRGAVAFVISSQETV